MDTEVRDEAGGGGPSRGGGTPAGQHFSSARQSRKTSKWCATHGKGCANSIAGCVSPPSAIRTLQLDLLRMHGRVAHRTHLSGSTVTKPIRRAAIHADCARVHMDII